LTTAPISLHAANLELAGDIAQFYDSPLGFVKYAYEWGRGALSNATGPDAWQTEYLEDLGREVRERGFDGITAVKPIRMATASGHGIGKSTLVAWIVNWLMSTRPDCQGTITANTFVQLQTKTWAGIQKWTALSITAHWFRVTGDRMYHVDYPSSWFCSAQTCKEENSEAFAGQHAASSTSFYIFDEASAVPDKVYEVAEGGLTDGSPAIFLFGNPTRNTGKFHRVTFGNERYLWNHRSIDSRTSAITNKQQIDEWVAFYGEDSDFVKVRVRGLPPSASELQFIPQDLVWGAQKREALALDDDPLIAGVDVSGGGAAWNVVRFRRGVDARTIPPIRIPGEHGRDRQVMIAKLAEVLSDLRPGRRIAAMFIDSAFGSPIVERLQMLGHKNVIEVNFGGRSPNAHQSNQRAYMWNAVKEWLPRGAIDKNDEKLEIDLTGPGFHLNRTNQLVIESKAEMQKRNIASPDDGDALALTFAQPVAIARTAPVAPRQNYGSQGWMA
jgi:hypothetical protein